MPVKAFTPKTYKRQTEESLQRRICTYIRHTYPNVIFFADASGVKMSDTKRISMSAMRSRDDRIPDLIIDEPMTHIVDGEEVTFHGARFEVKPEGKSPYRKDGTLKKQAYVRRFKNGVIKRGDHLQEQENTLLRYKERGYYARFVVGFEDAKRKIDFYMKNENASLF